MNEIELEYADYLINKLQNSIQPADDTDWRDNKLRYIEKLNNKGIDDVIATLESEGWIKRHQSSSMFSLDKQKISVLREYGSYSNYYKILQQQKDQHIKDIDLQRRINELQNESLEYQKTVRERDDKIAKLDIKLKRLELIQKWWWLISIILLLSGWSLSFL